MPLDPPTGSIASWAWLAELADEGADGLLAFDRDLRCVYGSLALQGLTGLGPAELVGRPAAGVFPFLVEADIRQALEGRRGTLPGGTFFRPGTAAESFLAGRYFPLHGPMGEVVGAGVAIRDTTPERHTAQKLRETESRFRNMANASPVLLWMAGPDGLCTFFNQTWLTFTGRTIEEEWGVGWAENVHFEEFETCMNTYTRAFNARAMFEMEYRLRRADGEYRWILDRGTPRYSPEGTFAGYIGSCVDITERRTLEADLRNSVRVRDEFLSVASHELGTPLTSLRLLVETLLRTVRRQPDDNQAARQIETRVRAIEDQVLRLSGLVETLLDVSAISDGRVSLSPEPLDLSELVQRVITRMGQVAVDAGCPVALQTPGPVPGVWDRLRTEQVVTNLLSNAFKYGAGKPVDVVVRVDDGAARVCIIDQGIGIPVEKQSVIFERFERAAPKNQYGGLGLGLWISRRALAEMGGAIHVQSQLGAGARFEIQLPRHA